MSQAMIERHNYQVYVQQMHEVEQRLPAQLYGKLWRLILECSTVPADAKSMLESFLSTALAKCKEILSTGSGSKVDTSEFKHLIQQAEEITSQVYKKYRQSPVF